MYARGILFGTMKYELGDHAYIRCPETGMVADLEFKTRGYFSGTYNAIGGFIKDAQGKQLFELSGLWNEEMYIKDLTVCKQLWQIQTWWLTEYRLERESSFSMRHKPNTAPRKPAPWRSRTSASRRSCGIMSPKPSNEETKTSRQTQKQRSRTGSERRRPSATARALIGSHNFSEEPKVVLDRPRKTR
jgi:hypothetical protein